MKKTLLASLFVLGAVSSFAQGNKVIVPFDSVSGDASTNVPIEVTGEVFDKASKSLVVEILSAASPDGTGFAFRMPHLYTGDNSTVKTAEGKFRVTIEQAGKIIGFNGKTPTVQLVQNGAVHASNSTTALTGKVTGTADDVTLKYMLTGKNNTAGTAYDGNLTVAVNGGTKSGTFSDTSVTLGIEMTGHTNPTP